jgi:hypothetical protein
MKSIFRLVIERETGKVEGSSEPGDPERESQDG